MTQASAPSDETRERLFAVYLGGELAVGRMGEDHEVVFVVARDVTAARAQAKKKWASPVGAPHVDAVREIDVVDGFAVLLQPTTRPETVDVDATYVPADPK